MPMRAKDFLKQVSKLNVVIENKLIEKEQWREIATNATAQYGGIGGGGKTGNAKQTMADAVGKMIDIEREINAMIDKLIDTKQDVISVIEQVNATEYDVLHKVYIQGMTFDEVAVAKKRSYTWATTVHGRACQSVQRILDEREKKCDG